MAEKAQLRSSTDWTIICYFLIFSVTCLGILFSLIFADKYDPYELVLVVGVFIGGLLIFGLVKVFRMFFPYLMGDIGKLNNTRVEMLYGLGGVIIATMVPRVTIFYCLENSKLFLLILSLSLIAAFSFHYFFNYGYNQHCEYNLWIRKPVCAFLIIVIQFASIFIARRASDGYKQPDYQGKVMIVQLGMLALSTVASIEFCLVWNGNFSLRGWSKRRRQNEKSENPGSLTECIFCACQHVTFLFFVILVAQKANGTISLRNFLFVLSLVVAITAFLMLSYSRLRGAMEKRKWPNMTQYRTESLIGYVFMLVFATVPRVFVYFYPLDLEMLFSCIFVCVTCALLSVGLYVRDSARHWKLEYRNHLKSIVLVGIFHFFTIIAALRILITYRHKEAESILFMQLGWLFVSFPATVDLVLILVGGMKSKPRRNAATELQSVKTVDNSGNEPQSQYQSHECKICCLEFNATIRIPRVLRECGHTLCGPCADILLKKTNGDILTCPFCQTITIVRGLSNLLPKNYGMLEIIEEHKTEEMIRL